MKARYWSASARIEIFARSTFCWRASVEQQVERALEALDVDHQRRLVGARARRARSRTGIDLRRHAMAVSPDRRWPSWPRTRARAAATIDRRRALARSASAASARRGASPASTGRLGRDRAHLVELAVAMQHDVAAGRERRRACARASVPDSAPIDMSSLINSPSNPMKPRITSRIIVAEVVAGATGSMAVNTTCAVIPSGKLRERPERREIGRFQRRAVGVDHRQRFDGCRRWRGRGRACA